MQDFTLKNAKEKINELPKDTVELNLRYYGLNKTQLFQLKDLILNKFNNLKSINLMHNAIYGTEWKEIKQNFPNIDIYHNNFSFNQ